MDTRPPLRTTRDTATSIPSAGNSVCIRTPGLSEFTKTVEVVACWTFETDGLLRLTVRPSGMPQIS